MSLPLAITCGDPAGVGIEVIVKCLRRFPTENFILIGPRNLFEIAGAAGGSVSFEDTGSLDERYLHCGRDEAACGAASHAAVERGVAMALAGGVAGLVTAPISKAAWKKADLGDRDHTTLIERMTGRRAVMAFSGREQDESVLRVALATIHIPLSGVPAALDADSLFGTIRILRDELVARWGVSSPVIAVTGLNPHAGEKGLMGDEDDRIIGPAIAAARDAGIRVEGPLPADAAFTPRARRKFDMILAMYHDQGLAPFKALTAPRGVNVTLGTGVVRTSPDHGTAYDIAGRGVADETSMAEAIGLAREMSDALNARPAPAPAPAG